MSCMLRLCFTSNFTGIFSKNSWKKDKNSISRNLYDEWFLCYIQNRLLFQCHAGHLVCSSCRPKLTCCPTCRGQLGGNIRNLAMEKVASTVMFPCRYQSSGCGLSLLHTDKTDHEETCEFRPYSCPCPGASCKWQGSLEQVMQHLMQVHKSITTLQGNNGLVLETMIGSR